MSPSEAVVVVEAHATLYLSSVGCSSTLPTGLALACSGRAVYWDVINGRRPTRVGRNIRPLPFDFLPTCLCAYRDSANICRAVEGGRVMLDDAECLAVNATDMGQETPAAAAAQLLCVGHDYRVRRRDPSYVWHSASLVRQRVCPNNSVRSASLFSRLLLTAGRLISPLSCLPLPTSSPATTVR